MHTHYHSHQDETMRGTSRITDTSYLAAHQPLILQTVNSEIDKVDKVDLDLISERNVHHNKVW